MADLFMDIFQDQLVDQTVKSEPNDNIDDIWEYCNIEETTNSSITPTGTDMFAAVEDLMISDSFYDPSSMNQIAEPPGGISIWDLIDMRSVEGEQVIPPPPQEEAPEKIEPEIVSNIQFKPVATQENFHYRLQPSRRRFELASSSQPSPSSANYGSLYSSPRNLIEFKDTIAKFERRRSISKMPLAELYEVMGLADDHHAAIEREEQIMGILERYGFDVGEKTWIRDTEEPTRRTILEAVYNETYPKYGYSKRLLEAIIRRGTYARMQSNLRRRRRRRRRIEERNQ